MVPWREFSVMKTFQYHIPIGQCWISQPPANCPIRQYRRSQWSQRFLPIRKKGRMKVGATDSFRMPIFLIWKCWSLFLLISTVFRMFSSA